MKQPPFDRLADWLAWQERLHPTEIELGLNRVTRVAEALGVLRPAPYVFTVAGTNGKGSSVQMLAHALKTSGMRVAAYTSPHLLVYNERIAVDGRYASDSELCEAFAAVESVRGDTSLTYFEFGTLAAFWLIKQSCVDVAVLEVGLGGRLDAVNIADADIALVTNVGLDHQDWLGDDRQSIGREKAGIFRAGRPAVYNDPEPVGSVREAAEALGADFYCLQRDYRLVREADAVRWQGSGQGSWLTLPEWLPPHQQENAAGVLMCLTLAAEDLNLTPASLVRDMGSRLPPGRNDLRRVAGTQGTIPVLLDVAHNREAAHCLAGQLATSHTAGRTRAVFAALSDKPIEEMTGLLAPMVDEWLVAGLTTSRGQTAQQTVARMKAAKQVRTFDDPASAWRAALESSSPEDRVVVFGSFYTVQAVLECIEDSMDGRLGND